MGEREEEIEATDKAHAIPLMIIYRTQYVRFKHMEHIKDFLNVEYNIRLLEITYQHFYGAF